MFIYFYNKYSFLIPIILITTSLGASPKIEIDSADFSLGTITENEEQSITHVFKIKNSGDSMLVISKVRPGCGCTTVSYDSLILPGATGTLTAAINAGNLHSGHFSKSITVTSNASDEPVALSISGVYSKFVELEENHIRLSSFKGSDTGAVVTISSGRKGFKVTGVSFAYNENNLEHKFHSFIPLKYKLFPSTDPNVAGPGGAQVKIDTLENAARYFYRLKILYSSKKPMDKFGEVIIKTNVPEKPEIRVSGTLESTNE